MMDALEATRLTETPTAFDPRWLAVTRRDPAADGQFFYSVATTGIYCRPSYASRLARPEHVRFHISAEDAERAGFRACKRCRPDRLSLAEEHAVKRALLEKEART